MFRSSLLGLCLALFLVLPQWSGAERNLLWRVVQTCIANHDVTGLPFPCLEVVDGHGLDQGYAVLRAPFDKSHIVVTPTVRTIGIEAARLRGPNAPDYFADAWANRFYATAGLSQLPSRADLAMAINSRPGRSQDQLHIHVDCIQRRVRHSLSRQVDKISAAHWMAITIVPHAPRYWALALKSPDLKNLNLFDLVATGLSVTEDTMADVTIVVVGNDAPAEPGFIVLARQRAPDGNDEAHGEGLMDHSCKAFR